MNKALKTCFKVVGCIVGLAALSGGIAFVKERIDEKKRPPVKHKQGTYERFVKRPLDCFLATGAFIVLSPVLAVTALLVKKKLGSPVLFTQERPGMDEKIFKLYKFRSMTEERDKNGDLLPDEIRLTSFGKLLRSTSLDELPELINIIKGDMAVVGPRPLLVQYLPYYTDKQHHRHDVRSGLTGYAQAHGRNTVNWDDKFKMDTEYVSHITFISDVKIIIDTMKAVFKHEGINSATSATMEDYRDYCESIGRKPKEL